MYEIKLMAIPNIPSQHRMVIEPLMTILKPTFIMPRFSIVSSHQEVVIIDHDDVELLKILIDVRWDGKDLCTADNLNYRELSELMFGDGLRLETGKLTMTIRNRTNHTVCGTIGMYYTNVGN